MKYEILLAEDDDSIRLVLNKALARAGHSVKATDNPETLLKWASNGVGDEWSDSHLPLPSLAAFCYPRRRCCVWFAHLLAVACPVTLLLD